MTKKTEKIVEMSHKKAIDRQNEVVDAVRRMQKEGRNITFYGVMKETGASKSYLYTNKVIHDLIAEARETNTPRTARSKDAIIKMQRSRIADLESKLTALQSEKPMNAVGFQNSSLPLEDGEKAL